MLGEFVTSKFLLFVEEISMRINKKNAEFEVELLRL